MQPHQHVLTGPWTPRSPQRFSGTPHEIRSIERHTSRLALDCERADSRHTLDRVVELQRLEDRPELMEPVGPRAEHTQVEIDLGVRANHDRTCCR